MSLILWGFKVYCMKKETVLFGAGCLGELAYKYLKSYYDIIYFCDNDENKWGKKINKIEIISPDKLKDHKDTIIIITSMYHKEILQQLLHVGITNVLKFDEWKFGYYVCNYMEDIKVKQVLGNYDINNYLNLLHKNKTNFYIENDVLVLIKNIKLSKENFGIIRQLKKYKDYDNYNEVIFRKKLIDIYGIHVNNIEHTKIYTSKEVKKYKDIYYKDFYFYSYDLLKIPGYILYPSNFNKLNKYPTVILFSGHGKMDQLAFEEKSYQKGAALQLAREGFLVVTMENRGMGKLSYLGDHLRIDAVARLSGGSWYGEIITDALYLIDCISDLKYVDEFNIGVAGVSTGGALSMIASALNEKIKATYVQGYLGSFRTNFGLFNNHCICNNISGILNIGDMHNIAKLIAPRSILYVNGKLDTFNYDDAIKIYQKIKEFYKEKGFEKMVEFKCPEKVGHELSVDLVISYFNDNLF